MMCDHPPHGWRWKSFALQRQGILSIWMGTGYSTACELEEHELP